MQTDRYYAWNFANLLGIGTEVTVEWRQPPGITTAEECLMWTELAVTFVHAALQPDSISAIRSLAYDDTVTGLQEFLLRGEQVSGGSRQYLNMAFDGQR